jgi:hypothetical protein
MFEHLFHFTVDKKQINGWKKTWPSLDGIIFTMEASKKKVKSEETFGSLWSNGRR